MLLLDDVYMFSNRLANSTLGKNTSNSITLAIHAHIAPGLEPPWGYPSPSNGSASDPPDVEDSWVKETSVGYGWWWSIYWWNTHTHIYISLISNMTLNKACLHVCEHVANAYMLLSFLLKQSALARSGWVRVLKRLVFHFQQAQCLWINLLLACCSILCFWCLADALVSLVPASNERNMAYQADDGKEEEADIPIQDQDRLHSGDRYLGKLFS